MNIVEYRRADSGANGLAHGDLPGGVRRPWEMPRRSCRTRSRPRRRQHDRSRWRCWMRTQWSALRCAIIWLRRTCSISNIWRSINPPQPGAGARLLSRAGRRDDRAAGGWLSRRPDRNRDPDSPPPDADRSLRTRASPSTNGTTLITGVPYPRPPSAPPEQPDFELMLLPGSAWTDGVLPGALDGAIWAALMVEGYGADPDAPGSRNTWTDRAVQRFATPTGLCYNLLAWDSQARQRIDRQHLPDS